MKFAIPDVTMPDTMREDFEISDGRLSDVIHTFYNEWVADGYGDEGLYEESGCHALVQAAEQLEAQVEQLTKQVEQLTKGPKK